jgi:AraC-like DNA-binding protein
MAKTNITLRETHIIGNGVVERVVSLLTCPALPAFGIGLTGTTDAPAGTQFQFTRLRPRSGQILVCLSGEGQVWTEENSWETCREGQAYITPPGVRHAYRVGPGGWQVCWVVLSGVAETVTPVEVPLSLPCLRDVDSAPLATSIEQLYREALGAASPPLLRLWAEMVHAQAVRLLEQSEGETIGRDARLRRLWGMVEASLEQEWTLEEMARRARLSEEQVRRLCHEGWGCSPMRHLTHLRMRHAAVLLASDTYTVAAVARRVGYSNDFAFSTAFKRHTGYSPSAYRAIHFGPPQKG